MFWKLPSANGTMWHLEHTTREFRLCRNRVAIAVQAHSSMAEGLRNRVSHVRRLAELLNVEESNEVTMTATNKQRGRHKIEKLLPWHATGTLSCRDADRVEQALAGDRELARRYELVRQELAEVTGLNGTLGAPSARAMEKLFAAINAEEARAPRRQRRPISRTQSLTSARDSAREKPSFD